MMTLTKLLRRTSAVALCAIAALTVPGAATAQTVTLSSGASCVYSSMTVNPSGNVAVTCGSATSPGTLAVVGPTSLATGTPYPTAVGVSRTGGSTGAASVHWAITGNNLCVSTDGTSPITAGDFSWATGESQTQVIPIQTGPTSGTCIVTLSAEVGAGVGTASRTKTINVLNGNDPVTFTLAAGNPNSTTVAGAGVNIVVNRAGGPSGDWTVPVTLSGGLTTGGALIVGTGTLSKTTLTFPAGSSSDTIVYIPPATAPALPTLPKDLTLILGTPVGPTPSGTGQTGSISGTNTYTMTLNPAPVTGCAPTSANDTTLGWGETPTLMLPSGQVGSFLLPLTSASRMFSGKIKASVTTNSPSDTYTGPLLVEVQISKCKGVITAPAVGQVDNCYASGTNRSQPIQDKPFWVFKAGMTDAQINSVGACPTPVSGAPYYINVRYTYTAGACPANCGYKWTPYPWNY